MDVLPRMIEIVRIVVADEKSVPACCQACRFSDRYLYGDWFCVNGRQIDFPRDKPDWCPIVTVESLKLKAER
jgi:hypothetical protein